MRKRLTTLAWLLLAASAAIAATRWSDTTGTATDVSATTTFSDAAGTFNARSVCLWDDDADAADSIYISLKGAAATTSDHELKYADKWICYRFDPAAGGDGWARADLRAAGGKTAAYRLEAMR